MMHTLTHRQYPTPAPGEIVLPDLGGVQGKRRIERVVFPHELGPVLAGV